MGQLLHRKKQTQGKGDQRSIASHTRSLERIMKGFANHRRIEIMFLLAKKPELSVEEIANRLSVNFKTISQHVQRLAGAGIIMKRNNGNFVRHKLTHRGETILKFLRIIE